MFEVKIDGVDQLLEKLSKYGGQITELHKTMPEELVTWQRDDMRRKYPNEQVATSGNETAASTEIWPRSRLESRNVGPKQHHIAHAAPKQHRIRGSGPAPRSTRPILREELLRKLHDRMLTLTSEAMKWP
jgi:hypothetical protein